MTQLESEIRTVTAQFAVAGELIGTAPFPGGHINESQRLTVAGADGCTVQYLLQRINREVFARPDQVMENIGRVTRHIAESLRRRGVDPDRRVLRLVPTRDGGFFHRDAAGNCWRMYHFIERARVLSSVQTPLQAEAAGRAFGEFQRMLADLPPPPLHDTIPDFHNTPLRLAALERAIAADVRGRVATARREIDFALSHRAVAPLLVDLQRSGAIPERIVHNDAKISNVLFDGRTGQALCVVDLDTVMPGLSLYDFGDMVRSMTAIAAEDDPEAAHVRFQPALFEALARGYLSAAGGILSAVERAHLAAAGELITYEQGMRFLTDYLHGDTYYRTTRPGQNLDRCRVQFALLGSLLADRAALARSIRSLR